MDAAQEDAQERADRLETVRYTYRPSLLGSPWEFEVTPQTLNFQVGRRGGQIPYRDIQRIRMAYRPVTLAGHRFLTEIWSKNMPKLPVASTSWKNMIEQERLDAPYRAFLLALHRKLVEHGATPLLQAGSPAFLYWPGVIIFAALALGMAGLAVRGLQTGALAGAAFVGAFFLLFLWQVGGFFRRNRPGIYRADALPAAVLPK
ncbi:MAG: hypothetical protein AB7K35_12050 [Pseudorhodoplanes sp.]